MTHSNTKTIHQIVYCLIWGLCVYAMWNFWCFTQSLLY